MKINILHLSFFVFLLPIVAEFFGDETSLIIAQGNTIMQSENENSDKTNFLQPNSPQANGDSISFRNETGNAILQIIDQGNDAASILLKSVSDTLDGNRLYQRNGKLMWQRTELKRIYKYSVGNWYTSLGGYVIEVSPNGEHGTVVAYRDHFSNANWYDPPNLINDETSWSYNQWSYSKNFKDWRLPTRRELGIIYTMKDDIGNFSDALYWSSTEYTYVRAIAVSLYTGSGANYVRAKSDEYRVRVVRTF